MMYYKDLNFKALREDCGIDFAHFTYQRGQCSCCYGPMDLPQRYGNPKRLAKRIPQLYDRDSKGKPFAITFTFEYPENYSYILFKNANNGTGIVTKNDIICVPGKHQPRWNVTLPYYTVNIEYELSDDQMEKVLAHLRKQLDDDYHLIRPSDKYECIQIKVASIMKEEDYEKEYRLEK